ncbi:hypothetical protein P5V15_014134 [Pogonomyrmex californicus]
MIFRYYSAQPSIRGLSRPLLSSRSRDTSSSLCKQAERTSWPRTPSRFDDCNLTNVKLYLNSECYPYDDMNLNFDKNRWFVLYETYAQFCKGLLWIRVS